MYLDRQKEKWVALQVAQNVAITIIIKHFTKNELLINGY